jgi:hypothetical protein
MAVQVWEKGPTEHPCLVGIVIGLIRNGLLRIFCSRCEYAALSLYLATGAQEYLDHVTVRATALRNAFTLMPNNS